MEKRKATSGFQRRRTLRLTAEEDERMTRQATTAEISVSEYMRRLFFGGRPIIARTDDQTIRELRRLGGLLKHYFEVVKRAGIRVSQNWRSDLALCRLSGNGQKTVPGKDG